MSTADLLVKINSLPADLKKELSDFIDRLLVRAKKSPSPTTPTKQRRQLGLLKGKIHIPDDFDEPLEDFKDYM
ncbi:MAG: DUF2281 domain-containing protein [Flavobacteriales bacterium]|nr:MAG: DUF2281 domain-containing protein [Flavobacteriales bacterium]